MSVIHADRRRNSSPRKKSSTIKTYLLAKPKKKNSTPTPTSSVVPRKCKKMKMYTRCGLDPGFEPGTSRKFVLRHTLQGKALGEVWAFGKNGHGWNVHVGSIHLLRSMEVPGLAEKQYAAALHACALAKLLSDDLAASPARSRYMHPQAPRRKMDDDAPSRRSITDCARTG
ncbi:uncharacterized protein SEPMUDRAFT_112089 [Sphaerulina musiva SO2202]|uniref:Uncharacterized protein n=1 Tax=Sphaerulina musiva (strain SO2202) TaxID=692275 RepID=M3C827_SPHMS|nr:uncharacterized protein SEPMUDRAFT_112089 [Sphaerulina musiva SO2202]EMF08045.1 hypothetical protein SEPMUDRAFT_112089 [Sphaerulina musiva SO2202]